MSDQPPSDILGALPRRRPQRRSDKRATPATPDSTPTKAGAQPKQTSRTTAEPTPAPPGETPQGRPQRLRQPDQPPGIPTTPRSRPVKSNGRQILGTAAQAAAELAEFGLAVGARAVRNAVGRLPRP